MSISVMNKYLAMSSKHMDDILKYILKKKYNKNICDKFKNIYYEVRYNGLIESKRGTTVRSKLLNQYRELKVKLLQSEKELVKSIEAVYTIFDEVTYFDTAIFERDYTNKINDIYEEVLEIADNEVDKVTFSKELLRIVQSNQREKLQFIKKFDTNEFRLQGSNINENIRRIGIVHNIKFPSIYSNEAIEKAFSSGVTKEDKLFVEFYLLSIRVILDVIKSDYRKKYFVSIDPSILSKAQKTIRLLEIINNPIIQDRVIMQIGYSDLEKYKKEVYNLISEGYRFAVELDDSYLDEKIEAEKLEVFEYILVSKEYTSLKGNDKVLLV